MENTHRKTIDPLPSFNDDGQQSAEPQSGHFPSSPAMDVMLDMAYHLPASPFEGSPTPLPSDEKNVVGSPQWVVEEEGIGDDWKDSPWRLPSIKEAKERRDQEIFNQGRASLWTKPEELALMGMYGFIGIEQYAYLYVSLLSSIFNRTRYQYVFSVSPDHVLILLSSYYTAFASYLHLIPREHAICLQNQSYHSG